MSRQKSIYDPRPFDYYLPEGSLFRKISVSTLGIITFFQGVWAIEIEAFDNYVLKKIFDACPRYGDPRKMFTAMHRLRGGYTAISQNDPLHESRLAAHSVAKDGQHRHLTSETPVTLEEFACMLEQYASISQLSSAERERLVEITKGRLLPTLEYGRSVNWHGQDYPSERRQLAQFDQNEFNPHVAVFGDVDPKEIVLAYKHHLEQYRGEIDQVRELAFKEYCATVFSCRNQKELAYLWQLTQSTMESMCTGFTHELVVQTALYSGLVRENAARNILALCLTLFVLYSRFSIINCAMNIGFILLNYVANPKIQSLSQSALLMFALYNSTDIAKMIFATLGAETGKQVAKTAARLWSSSAHHTEKNDNDNNKNGPRIAKQ